jgi:integrase
MARPRTEIGTYGRIHTRQVSPHTWEARARFRGADGRLKPVKRSGPTKTQAENKLKKALLEMARSLNDSTINRDTKFKVLGEAWYAEVKAEVANGAKSPNSLQNYRGILTNHLYPALEELAAFEVTVTRCDELLKEKRAAGYKYDALVGIKSVLSNVCGFAIRHKAMSTNPARDVARLTRGDADTKEVRSLSGEQRDEALAALDADPWAVERDVPDVMRGLLATAVRISELLACTGDDVVKDGKGRLVLVVDHRIVRETGVGLVRRRRSDVSSKGGGQRLILPSWAVPLFTARKLASGGSGPLFPNPFAGGWRDPSGPTAKVLRKVLDDAGFDWVTSHVFGRKTVITEMDRAGMAPDVIKAQSGHRTFKTTEKHYIERRASNDGALGVLESLAPSVREQSGT